MERIKDIKRRRKSVASSLRLIFSGGQVFFFHGPTLLLQYGLGPLHLISNIVVALCLDSFAQLNHKKTYHYTFLL